MESRSGGVQSYVNLTSCILSITLDKILFCESVIRLIRGELKFGYIGVAGMIYELIDNGV